jgi:hypothetical protein
MMMANSSVPRKFKHIPTQVGVNDKTRVFYHAVFSFVRKESFLHLEEPYVDGSQTTNS